MSASSAIGTSLALGFAVFCASGCSTDTAAPAVEPMLTLSSTTAAPGDAVEMTYRFRVLPDATFNSTYPYHVMVHFAGDDDQLLFADDHDPPQPVSSWKPGQIVEYRRTWFVPRTPYAGHAVIELALYTAGDEPRVALLGTDLGQRSYAIGAVDVKPQSERSAVYREGWHDVERAADGSEWRWSKKEGVLDFPNPRKDAALYLSLDVALAVEEPQEVSVFCGNTLLERLTVTPAQPAELHRILVPAAAWGSDPTGRIRLVAGRTFVPMRMTPPMPDSRELGVRVFHAAIVPSR